MCVCAISKLLQQLVHLDSVAADTASCCMLHSMCMCMSVCVYVFQAKFIDIHCLFVVDRWPSSLSLSQPTEITIVASFLATTTTKKLLMLPGPSFAALAAHRRFLRTPTNTQTYTHTCIRVCLCVLAVRSACNWLLVYNSCFFWSPVGCR